VSSVSSQSASPVQIERFQGGRQWVVAGGGAGLFFLVLTLIGLAIDPAAASYSYLVAFSYWAGITMAALILLMIFHAVRAKWMVILRRPVEAMATTIPIFILLFIPVIFGMKHLYSWVTPPADSTREFLRLIEHKRPWLNTGFFIGRGFFYLLLATVVSWRLFSLSKKQDLTGEIALTQRQRNLGAGALPFIALAITFASFDWLMSLNPTWFSTVFGVYFFGGSFVSVLSLLAIVTDLGRSKNLYGAYITPDHTHNIGKLMLAFVCFWTYIAFSQFMLIWIAGLPEEVPFYITRFKHGWAALGIFMIVGHFFVPFACLLSRSLKRDSRKLAAVAFWILMIHYLDIYWLVMPTLTPEGVSFHWTSLTAFLGIGLLAIAFAVTRLRGQYAIPVKDPYLADSLRYRQP
jgi:hypothetical protein